MKPFADIPAVALSIQNPWAFLIVYGYKSIENRDWAPKHRGPIALHAGKNFDGDALNDVTNGIHPVTGDFLGIMPEHARAFDEMRAGKLNGGIFGVADLVDVVTVSDSPWFVGRKGLVLANPRPVPFIPVRGMQGMFPWRKMLTEAQIAEAA